MEQKVSGVIMMIVTVGVVSGRVTSEGGSLTAHHLTRKSRDVQRRHGKGVSVTRKVV